MSVCISSVKVQGKKRIFFFVSRDDVVVQCDERKKLFHCLRERAASLGISGKNTEWGRLQHGISTSSSAPRRMWVCVAYVGISSRDTGNFASVGAQADLSRGDTTVGRDYGCSCTRLERCWSLVCSSAIMRCRQWRFRYYRG